MICASLPKKPSHPYPIYLSGSLIEADFNLAEQHRQDYRNGVAFTEAFSDISWLADLEATYEEMINVVPGYLPMLYKLRLAERIAFAICIEHPEAGKAIELFLAQENDQQLLSEVSTQAGRMQNRELPQGFQWLKPCNPDGSLRSVAALIHMGVVTAEEMIDRALTEPQRLTLVPALIASVGERKAIGMYEHLTKRLLQVDESIAQDLRVMMGIGQRMSLWEASKRFTLMMELGAKSVLDEEQLWPDSMSANHQVLIALQIEMLRGERSYLNELAREDLAKVINRMLLDGATYPKCHPGVNAPFDKTLIEPAIEFAMTHVRMGRDILINALNKDASQGELYCPAPWAQSASRTLRRNIERIEAVIDMAPRMDQMIVQLGNLVAPKTE